MSKKANEAIDSTKTVELEDPDRSPLTPTDAVDEQEIKKIEDLLRDTELAGGSIRLERKGPSDSAYQYCTKIRVADGLDLDLIKRVWGGGDYKARTFRSNGQTYKQFQFSIDYRIKGSMDATGMGAEKSDQAGDLVKLATVFKQDNGSSTLFMKMMEQSNSQNSQMMALMMSMQQQGQQQMMGMMTAMATAFGGQRSQSSDIAVLIPVLTAMINKPERAGKESGLLEMVTALKTLKELAAPGSVPPEKEEKEETMLDKILKYGGPVVAALLTRQPIQMPGATSHSEVEQPAQLPPPSINIDSPSQTMDSNLPPEFKAYINMIAGAAAKNSDTGIYADLISDNLTDEQGSILCDILQQPDWVEKLAQTDRRVLSFVPWFTKLRGELFEIYGIESTHTADAGTDAAPDANGAKPVSVAPTFTLPGARAVGATAPE